MKEILKLMIQYKNPIIISTKSDLILRDYDLIAKLASLTYVNIACTITTADEKLRQLIEPGAVSSARRFEVLRTFSHTNASTGMHVMPILPYLTDSYENLNALYYGAKQASVDYVLPCTLNLRGKTRPYFLSFVKEKFPEQYASILKLYQNGGVPMTYKNNLYSMVNDIKKQYDITSSYNHLIKEKLKKDTVEQLSFF